MDLIPSNLSSHEVWLFNESGVNLPCVGSIISSYLILTLASCLHGNGQGKGRNKLSIKTKSGNGLNSNLKLEEEQIRRISQIIFHPDSKIDLAILVLDENLDSSVKILPILNILYETVDESTWTNFSGRFCREDFIFSPLEISDSSECPFSSAKSDKFCLLPLDSNEKDSSCSSPLGGSSLICSDEKRGQFFCGILNKSPEKVGENGQIYTNITRHLKWIESVSAEVKSGKSRKLNSKENEETSFELSAGDYDYKMAANFPDFEHRPRKTRNATYDVVPLVVGGGDSDPIPYQLSIRYQMSPPNGEWTHICGAVILDEKTAITAAHCFVKTTDVRRYQVVAGARLLNTTKVKQQVLPVQKITLHPDFTNATNGNDIAILHVDKFRLNKYAQAAWLSPFSNGEIANKNAVISGWGQISNVERTSNSLQKGTVTILSPTECQRQVKQVWKVPIKNGILCALNPDIRTCNGDSGGPLVIQNYTLGNTIGNLLVGITSFGAIDCEISNTAGGYTEISHFYDWIQEKRAKKPCGEKQLPCVTGGCYDEELRCDKGNDCIDGTDEINCSKEEKTTPCGGFINLAVSPEQEIIYKVPKEDPERQRDSICLWIVSTGRQDAGASIEATILNNPSAQFNSSSDVIFIESNYTINQSRYKTVNRIETKYTTAGAFVAVYYRTNSSAPNAGFHLKLKDATTQSNLRDRLNVKLINLPDTQLNEGEIREFSYPESVSGAFRYSSNERTFVILKPGKAGAKIRVNLTFVDTQENRDWLEIATYRTDPDPLKRFSGRSNWTEIIFEELDNEPILFYFHSGVSQEKGGFKFQYSEIVVPKSFSCGGFVRLEEVHEIVYKVPEELRGEKSVCAWVVAAVGGSSIETKVLGNPRALFDPEESTLFALNDFNINVSRHNKIIALEMKKTIDQPFLVLYFRTNSSAPNSGFHILLKEAGKREIQKPVKYLQLTPTEGATSSIQEFKYPQPPASNYTNDERTFIILKPTTRQGKLKLDLKSVSTEKSYDWVEILSFESGPVSNFRFNGDGLWSNKSFVAEEDEPFIIYFHSDHSNTGSGFQFSYTEPRKSDFEKTRPPTPAPPSSTFAPLITSSNASIAYLVRNVGSNLCLDTSIRLTYKSKFSLAKCYENLQRDRDLNSPTKIKTVEALRRPTLLLMETWTQNVTIGAAFEERLEQDSMGRKGLTCAWAGSSTAPSIWVETDVCEDYHNPWHRFDLVWADDERSKFLIRHRITERCLKPDGKTECSPIFAYLRCDSTDPNFLWQREIWPISGSVVQALSQIERSSKLW